MEAIELDPVEASQGWESFPLPKHHNQRISRRVQQ